MNKLCCGRELSEREKIFSNNTKHIQLFCSICGKKYEFKSQPVEDFILYFGKFKGKKLSETPREYLLWCLENLNDKKIKEKIQEFFKKH